MNKKEFIEEVIVSDSASPSTRTNTTLRADGAVGEVDPQEALFIMVTEKRRHYSCQEC